MNKYRTATCLRQAKALFRGERRDSCTALRRADAVMLVKNGVSYYIESNLIHQRCFVVSANSPSP